MWKPFNEYFSEQFLIEATYVVPDNTTAQVEYPDGRVEKIKTPKEYKFKEKPEKYGGFYVFQSSQEPGKKLIVPTAAVKQLGKGWTKDIARVPRELGKDDVETYKRPSYIEGAAITALSDFIHALARPTNYALTLTPEDVMDRLKKAKVTPDMQGNIFVDGEKMTDRDDLANQGIDISEYMSRFNELKDTKNIKELLNKLAAAKNIEWLNFLDTDQGFNVVKRSDKMGLEREPAKPGQEISGALEKLLGKSVEGEREYAAQQQSGEVIAAKIKQNFKNRVDSLRTAWQGISYDDAFDEFVKLRNQAQELAKYGDTEASETLKRVEIALGKKPRD